MRILIDAMGAPEASGGMNRYGRELVSAWAETFPEDTLVVIAGAWAAGSFRSAPNVEVRVVRGASAVRRAWTQLVTSGRRFHAERADALLSLSPVVSPLVPSAQRAVIVHDWRHERRASEFGAAQRLYRRLWRISIRSAGTTMAVSEKTAAECRRFSTPRRLVVVESGGDHARRWQAAPAGAAARDAAPIVLTYGHLPNKRPEPVIRALGLVARADARLVVLGAAGRYREQLRTLADRCGVGARVELPGFVDEDAYRRILASSSVMVLNSSDEGFGLPVVEAEQFGIPVVVAADSGLDAIHPGRVAVARPNPSDLATAIDAQLAAPARRFPPRPSWNATARAVRAALGGGAPVERVPVPVVGSAS